jgi:hypothetical protein
VSVANSKTLSVSIQRKPNEVYDFISNPENLPLWAPAFCQSVSKSEGEWIVQTTDGTMKIKFVERNEFGVLDHYVTVTTGQEVLNPMRVIPNGSGCEVMFTLFQWPHMSGEKFSEDTGLVEKDLRTLKNVLEK